MHYINSKFAFPLEVGKEWSNNAVGISDTSEVTEKKQISTPVETFTNAFNIERDRNGLNDYIHISYWFVNDVGFAKLYFKRNRFFIQNIYMEFNQLFDSAINKILFFKRIFLFLF